MSNKYSLRSIIYGTTLIDTETECIEIRDSNGTLILSGCGDCGSPFTEDRKKLDEMIELANEAAFLRKIK